MTKTDIRRTAAEALAPFGRVTVNLSQGSASGRAEVRNYGKISTLAVREALTAALDGVAEVFSPFAIQAKDRAETALVVRFLRKAA